jgi:hypothetical protein
MAKLGESERRQSHMRVDSNQTDGCSQDISDPS